MLRLGSRTSWSPRSLASSSTGTGGRLTNRSSPLGKLRKGVIDSRSIAATLHSWPRTNLLVSNLVPYSMGERQCVTPWGQHHEAGQRCGKSPKQSFGTCFQRPRNSSMSGIDKVVVPLFERSIVERDVGAVSPGLLTNDKQTRRIFESMPPPELFCMTVAMAK